MSDQPLKHGHQHGILGPDPLPTAILHIKVTGDDVDADDPVEVKDGAFIFAFAEDMDVMNLVRAEAYLSTASGGDTVVQIRNVTQAHDMLSTEITVEGGDLVSKDAATQPVVSSANRQALWGDLLAIDVDAADGDGFGLGVILAFSR